MPVYLFTFHAYRSWMPDHRRGYTKRAEGYLPPDPEMARNYERRAKQNPSFFDPATEEALIRELMVSATKIHVHLHAGATEVTHIHALVSWNDERDWLTIRKSLKTSLTKRLKELSDHTLLSRGGSRKQIKDRDHFDYLISTYLPKHSGLAWYEYQGWVQSRSR